MARRFVFACEFAVGEALAEDLAHAEFKALRIVHVFAVVETEHLFVKVAIEMVRLNRNIRAMQLPLHQRPEVLNRVRMNLAAHVLDGMVNHFVLEMFVQSRVRLERIGVERSTRLDVFVNQRVHHVFAALVYDLSPYSSSTFHKADYGCLVVFDDSSKSITAMLVHVPSLAADEGFIHFHFTSRSAHLGRVERILHCQPQALQHEPCRLLCNAKRAVNLHARHSVLTIAKHPERSHPLVESERGILENRPDLQRELLITATAEPQFPRLNEVVAVRLATRTRHLAVGKAQLLRVLKTAVWIAEVNDGLLQSLGRFHGSNVRRLFACVKYIFAQQCK